MAGKVRRLQIFKLRDCMENQCALDIAYGSTPLGQIQMAHMQTNVPGEVGNIHLQRRLRSTSDSDDSTWQLHGQSE
jgi:hypothetical protein